MSTFTLEQANSTLSSSGILLRLMPKGLELMQKTQGFLHAMEFCLRNNNAKQDVLKFLSPHAKNADLVVLVQDRNQIMPNMTPSQPAPVNKPQNNSVPAQQQSSQAPVQQKTNQAPTQQSNQEAVQRTAPAHSPEQKRDFDGHHVYGRTFALYFAVDATKGDSATIAIDGAKAKSEKSFDWEDKLRIQITRNDLPTVAAVFFGLLPDCELQHYGACHSKRLMIKNQGGNFFVNMSAKDKPQIAVPIQASDVFEIRALFLQQLLANRPAIGVEGMLANLKLHAHMLKAGAVSKTQSHT